MKKFIFSIIMILCFVIAIYFIDNKQQVEQTANEPGQLTMTGDSPPAEMNNGMSNPVDGGDSLVISFEPISNDSMKFFYSIDSTGVIDSIFVNLCYYRIFCSDSAVSFKIIYE